MSRLSDWYQEKKIYLFILLLAIVFYAVDRWDVHRYQVALDAANEALKACNPLPMFK